MRTRREQVQAYRFVTRRVSSALLSGEPETTELPMRRMGLAVFASAMLAAIVVAAVGVFAVLNPGGGRLADNSIVIERETGARYVYVKQQLHPVLNYSSARLILEAAQPTTKTLSRRSLRDVPRGEPVGIANAPDGLPDRTALIGPPWSTCSMRRAPGSTALASHLLLGSVPADGADLGRDALLVSAGTGGDATRYLLWNNHRLKVRGTEVLAALQMASARPVPVSEELLNSITAGPDLIAGWVSSAGQDGPPVGGQPSRIGQVYRTGEQFYVLLTGGLVPIGEVMARLLQADGGEPVEIPASAAGNAQTDVRFEPEGFPYDMPRLRNTGTEPPMVCSTFRGQAVSGNALTTIELFDRPDPQLAAASANLPSARVGEDGVRLADRVVVPGGHGALVRILPAPDAPTPNTTRYLITDQGIKYALPRDGADSVQQALGYAGVTPTPVPSFLLSLLPSGPALDPAAAGLPVAAAEPSAGPTSPGPASPGPTP
jgi:type VII secretion protein EccB